MIMAMYASDANLALFEGRVREAAVALEGWTALEPFIPAQVRTHAFVSVALTAWRCANSNLARDLYGELTPHAGEWAGPSAEITLYGVDHALGWCAAAMGDVGRADGHLRDALRFYERVHSRPLWAITVADLGELERAEDELRAAALDVARELDLVGVAQRLVR